MLSRLWYIVLAALVAAALMATMLAQNAYNRTFAARLSDDLVRDREAFASWHYKNDPTHVCFFSRRTWQWWAGRQGASLEFIGADVIMLGRP